MAAPPSPKAAKLQTALQEAGRLHQMGRLAEAEKAVRGVLRERPSHPEGNFILGIVLKGQGRVADAEAAFRRVAAMAPESVAGHNNLGNILFEQGKLAEAETSYRRALALDPNMVDALRNLGLVLIDEGRATESVPWLRRHAELAAPRRAATAARENPPPHKVAHDREQCDYLKGLDIGAAGDALPFHIEEGARMPGRAVNPDASAGAIEAKWRNDTPQLAVIDNLLNDAALERLRQFCWRSTVWHDAYPNGYLGAMPEHGFACPLLSQVAEELRSNYPAIVGDHPLLRWWGFKYDSRLKGINVHADFAAVNVNFWIAPDDANTDPQGGGLVIWDKPAPLEWSFDEYNNPKAGENIRSFLQASGAKSITVPHRANRAVIFDSDLFHETDRITFKEGYTNRRINITMLYGRREAAGKLAH